MPAPSPRDRVLRRAAAVFTLGLLLSVMPAPRFEFLERSFVDFQAFPGVRDVAAAELEGMEDAMEAAEEWEDAQGDDADTTAAGEEGSAGDHDHAREVSPEGRVVGTENATEDFTMIGVRLEDEPAEPVMVRARNTDGTWGDWAELHVNPDEGPDPGSAEDVPAVVTEPVWVGEADAYQVSLDGGDVDLVEDVAVVRERDERVVADSTPLAGAASAPPFGVRSRAEWGARPPNGSLSAASKVQMAVVHHTVSPNGYSQAQVPGYIRGIQAYHIDGRGWTDIGYNFVVDRFGGIWEGRGGGITRAIIGAHAAGFNTGSVGVVALGTYTSTGPSSATVEGIAKVVGWKLWSDRVDPRATTSAFNRPAVVGHRDVGQTSCPGLIHASLGTIRARAYAWYRFLEAGFNPVGSLDSVTADGNRVTVRGWTADPGVTSSVNVHIALGSVWKVTTANRPRPDVAAVHPHFGSRRGYQVVYDDVPAGVHRVCAYGINQGRGLSNSTLGCTDVIVK